MSRPSVFLRSSRNSAPRLEFSLLSAHLRTEIGVLDGVRSAQISASNQVRSSS
jgi:hypothetical protein